MEIELHLVVEGFPRSLRKQVGSEHLECDIKRCQDGSLLVHLGSDIDTWSLESRLEVKARIEDAEGKDVQ